MRLFIDLLEKRLADSPHARFIQALNQAHHNGELMLAGLLDLSRLEAGSVAVRREEFAINDLLDRLNSEFRPLAESRDLRIRVRGCALTVFSDPLLCTRSPRTSCPTRCATPARAVSCWPAANGRGISR